MLRIVSRFTPISTNAFDRLTHRLVKALFIGLLISAPIHPAIAQSSCPSPGTGSCEGAGPAALSTAGPAMTVGNPIHLATGNKYQREVDLPALPGLLGLELTRHYNSRMGNLGWFGMGWRSSYEAFAYAMPTNVQIIQADGRRIIFNRDAKNPSLCSTGRPLDGRVEETDRAFVWRWPDGRTLTFAKQGRLERIEAPSGEVVTIEYDRKGRPWRITDPQGRQISLVLQDDAGHKRPLVKAIVTPVGRIQYQYDVSNRLISMTMVDGVSRLYHYEADAQAGDAFNLTGISRRAAPSAEPQRIGSYRYDEQDRAVRSEWLDPLTGQTEHITLAWPDRSTMRPKQADAALTTLTDSAGRVSRYTWSVVQGDYVLLDAAGPGCSRCPPANTSYRYDSRGLLIEMREADAITRTEYDTQARVTRITRQALVARQPRGEPTPVIRYDYADARRSADPLGQAPSTPHGLPSRITRPSVIAGRDAVIDIEWNADQQPVRLTERGWSPVSADGQRQLTAISRVTDYRYARLGGVSKLEQRTRSDVLNGNVVPVERVSYRYDNSGRLMQIATAAHTTVIHDRDAQGHPILIARNDGHRLLNWRIERDPQGQARRITEAGWWLDERQAVRADTAAVRVITAPSAAPAMRANSGDLLMAAAQPISASQAAAGAIDAATTTNAAQSSTSLAPSARTRASAGVTGFIADTASAPPEIQSLPIDEANVANDGDADAALAAVQRDAYARPVAWQDDLGRAALKAVWGPVGSVAQQRVMAWQTDAARVERAFDDFGRVVAIKNPAQDWQTAVYDAANRLVRGVDPRGAVQGLRYDAAGRLLRIERYASSRADAPSEVIRFGYAGQLLIDETIEDPNGQRRIDTQYDALGRPIVVGQSVQWQRAGEAATPPIRFTQTIDYDAQGHRRASTLSDSHGQRSTVVNEFDAQGRISAIQLRSWLGMHPLVSAIDWQTLTLRDAAQTVNTAVRLTHGNGLVDELQHAQAVSSVSNAMGPVPAPQPVQVASADTNPPLRDLFYRPDRHPAMANAYRPGVDHDAAGLPQRIDTPSAGMVNLTWDVAGRLRRAQSQDTTSRYVYDPRGRRIAKLVNRTDRDNRPVETATLFFYDGDQLIGEADAAGHLTDRIVYLGYRPIARLQTAVAAHVVTKLRGNLLGPTIHHLHTDHRGAVTQVSNAKQQTEWSAQVELNGYAHVIDASAATSHASAKLIHQPLRLIGQYADDETGLHYHVARYYDPSSGRFISPDPVGVADAVGNTSVEYLLDLYIYAGGNPDEYFDPDGAAKLRYYAIDDGVRINANTMPDRGHWAFAVWDIAGHEDKVFLYDRGGSYFTSGTNYNLISAASGADQAIGELQTHYRNRGGYYSTAAFEKEWSDDQAKELIYELTGTDLGTANHCIGYTLPTIDLGVQGVINPTAKTKEPLRIVAVSAQATPDEVLFQRIKKTIEAHESSDKDCARAAYLYCPAATWNPALLPLPADAPPNQARQRIAASFGWTQFIFSTLFDQLRRDAQMRTTLGISQADLNTAMNRLAKSNTWYDRFSNSEWVTRDWTQNGAQFTADTGLGQADYERMSTWNQIKATLRTARTAYAKRAPCTNLRGRALSDCIWNQLKVNDITAYNDVLQRAAILGATKTDLNPFIRDTNDGEARAGFGNAAALSVANLGDRLIAMFADKDLYDRVSDPYIRQNIRTAANRLNLELGNTLSAKQEWNIASRTFRMHNGNDSYPPLLKPVFDRTIALQANGNAEYLRFDKPLEITK